MSDCIFCDIANGDEKSWKVYENERVFAFLDIHPVNGYHTLVIPKEHYVNIFDIPESELVAVMQVVKELVDLYNKKLGIKNVQIINSSGKEAQQDVFHIHFHIVPRYKQDGQNVKWTTYAEWTAFNELLEKLQRD